MSVAHAPEAGSLVADAAIDQLARAVLYEGYTLYPYRPSALKNQRRFAFGAIYPRAWAARTLDPALLRAEVVTSGLDAQVAATVRFLRLDRGGGAREIAIDVGPGTMCWDDDGLALDIELSATALRGELRRFAIEIRNVSAIGDGLDHEAVMDVVPASTHVALRVTGGTFVSAIDPPDAARADVAACRSSGLYPILVGASGSAMLAAPIILPDYPELAPQSPGDFFDGTEIDEMLTLRVLTMTDAEKREAAAADPKIAALIARTEALGIEATAGLHGVVRTPWPRPGARVRVRPSRMDLRGRGTDAFDLLLVNKLATVVGVDRDLEGCVLCAVTIDDDPGADLGAAGLPGHRFYFRPDELEVIL